MWKLLLVRIWVVNRPTCDKMLISNYGANGSFIPAKEASFTYFDRIFTRIGASDDILTGKSTSL